MWRGKRRGVSVWVVFSPPCLVPPPGHGAAWACRRRQEAKFKARVRKAAKQQEEDAAAAVASASSAARAAPKAETAARSTPASLGTGAVA